jgi:transposase
MNVTTIGIDLAKSVFQFHGVDEKGGIVLRKKLRRSAVLDFLRDVSPCLIGLEACATAHFWAREISGLGHDVRLIPPAYVKPYVKRQKNDAADAEAICEAVTRPNMRFVPIKSAERQGVLMLHRTRDLLMRQRTMMLNAVRGHLAEFGIVTAQGPHKILLLIREIRKGEVPGLPQIAQAALESLKTGRQFAAFLGLVPRQNSSGGKDRLGRISKMGDGYLRRLLVVGATSVVRRAGSNTSATGVWVRSLLERKPSRVVTVAIANKTARVAWAILARGGTYRAPRPA